MGGRANEGEDEDGTCVYRYTYIYTYIYNKVYYVHIHTILSVSMYLSVQQRGIRTRRIAASGRASGLASRWAPGCGVGPGVGRGAASRWAPGWNVRR